MQAAALRSIAEVAMGEIRRKFWLESALALACGALAALTLAWRAWIEALTGLDPDRHGGSLEWFVVAGLAACSIVVGRAAWNELQPARSTPV
jgi:hypothetical protein